MRNLYALALAGALAAVIAGCGSSKKSTSTAAATTATATPAANEAKRTPYGSGAAGAKASNASAGASGGQAVVVSSKHSKLGTILAAGSKHLTVYLFEADKGSSSACTGACEKAWPPVTASGASTSAGARAADLGTITRPDGSKQVTYKGHPLYYFEQDKDAGDAYGQGSKAFGAGWYVLTPAGNKVDTD